MNRRERILAIAVAALAALAAANYMVGRVRSALKIREREIAKLQRQINEKRRVVRMGQQAAARKAEYEQRALPNAPDQASSLYRAWLLELVNRAGWKETNVTALPGRPLGDIYTSFTFMVAGRANWEQLTRLLYDFYSADHLHKISMLVIKPVPDQKDLDLTISIEALSLPGSVNQGKLCDRRSQRLAYDSVQPYIEAIAGRNITSPPHQPPRITVDARPTYYLGDVVSFTVRAEDPEGEPVRYALGEDAPPGVEIDPSSGRVRAPADKLGEYAFTVVATDSGLPPKSSSRQVRYRVVERPVAAAPPGPPPFDHAKYAFLTGVIDVAGRPQAWVYIRTQDRLLKLSVGDPIDVGSIKGVVARIGQKHAEIEAEGELLTVALGESLADARRSPSGR